MKKTIILLIILTIFSLISLTQTAEPYKTKGVTVLDNSNIDSYIGNKKAVLVLLYSGSNQSEDMKEEFHNAANILNRMPNPPDLARFKITKEKELVEFKVVKVPTLIYYIEGKGHDLGHALEPQILQIVQKVEGKVIQVRNQEEINMITKETPPYTVNLMYVGNTDDTDYPKFLDIIAKLKDVRYSICQSEICEKKYPKALQSIVMIKNYLPNREVIYDRSHLENELTYERVIDWLNKNSVGYVMVFTERLLQIGFGTKNLALVIWRNNNSKQVREYNKMLTNLAKKEAYSEFAFYASDIEGDENTVEAFRYFSNGDSSFKKRLPLAFIYDNRDGEIKTYDFTHDVNSMLGESVINEANLKAFITLFKEGNLRKKIYSQKAEEAAAEQAEVSKKIAHGDSRVKALVRSNFYNEVIDNNNDIFVMFYADWCEHCHEIMPLFESLAQFLALTDTLKFAKIDMSKNTIDGSKVKEFPTFLIYSANSKDEPKEYTGNADLEEFAAFVKSSATHKVNVPHIAKEADKTKGDEKKENKKTSKVESQDL